MPHPAQQQREWKLTVCATSSLHHQMPLQDHRQTFTYALVPHEATPKWRAITHGELSDFRFEAVREDTGHSRPFNVHSSRQQNMTRADESKSKKQRVASGILNGLSCVLLALFYALCSPFIVCFGFYFFCLVVSGRWEPCGTGRIRRHQREARRRDKAAEEGKWKPSWFGPHSFSVSLPPALAPRRPVTPSPEDTCESSQRSSPFFSRLPAELRSMILKEAFGGQTIHIDRYFDHPRQRCAACPSWCPSSEGDDVDLERSQRQPCSKPHTGHWSITSHRLKSKSHRWRSSVCHRNPPASDAFHPSWMESWWQPYDDSCRWGNKQHCDAWPGQWPLKCTIGAMGWLRTCRHAYTESVAVLYGTNTFHLPHKALVHISRFVRPAYLARIQRLEVVLKTEYLAADSHSELVVAPGAALYDVLASCDHVQRLTIGIDMWGRSWRGTMSPVDITSVLKQMDDVLMALPRVQGISVAFPSMKVAGSQYHMKKLAGETDGKNEDLPHGTTHQLWRNLDKRDDVKLVEWRCCAYPEYANPLYISAGQLTEDGGRGYWIFRGEPLCTQDV